MNRIACIPWQTIEAHRCSALSLQELPHHQGPRHLGHNHSAQAHWRHYCFQDLIIAWELLGPLASIEDICYQKRNLGLWVHALSPWMRHGRSISGFLILCLPDSVHPLNFSDNQVQSYIVSLQVVDLIDDSGNTVRGEMIQEREERQ